MIEGRVSDELTAFRITSPLRGLKRQVQLYHGQILRFRITSPLRGLKLV